MDSQLSVFIDGGARGNPGPAACAFVAKIGEQIIYKEGKLLGTATNNTAEYQGVLSAVKWFNTLSQDNKSQFASIIFFMDSQLVVNQLNGKFKIKSPHLIQLYYETISELNKIKATFIFKDIPRSKNTDADSLLNDLLDSSK